MNKQFRIAQKTGLIFRPGTAIPKDIKAWAISHLHSTSPALGIESISSKVETWPQTLQPDLDELAKLFRLLQGTYIKNREIKNTKEKQVKDHQNWIKHSMIKKDVTINQTFWVGVYPGLDKVHLNYIAEKYEEFFGLGF